MKMMYFNKACFNVLYVVFNISKVWHNQKLVSILDHKFEESDTGE